MASKAETYRKLSDTARAAWPGRIAVGPGGSMEVNNAGALLISGTSAQVVLRPDQAIELANWLLEQFSDPGGGEDEDK